jgi:hypothetical protein
VADAKGEPRPVLVGYACHDTTMGVSQWLGDYAGYAREYPENRASILRVAAFSNVMNGYIPNRRVLEEGGYEAVGRPRDPSLEERIVAKVRELFDRVNK